MYKIKHIEPYFTTAQFEKSIEMLLPVIDATTDMKERAEHYGLAAAWSLAATMQAAVRNKEQPNVPFERNTSFKSLPFDETKRFYQLCILNAIASHSPRADDYKYSYARFLAHYLEDIAESALVLSSISLDSLQIQEDLWHRALYLHQIQALLGATLVLSGIVEGELHLMKAYAQEMIDQAKWCDLGALSLLAKHNAVLSKSCKAFLIEALSNYEKSTDEMLADLKALREQDNA